MRQPFTIKHIGWSRQSTHDQNQPKSLPAQSHGQSGIMHETLTHGIVHAGYRGFLGLWLVNISRCKLIGNHFVIPHDTIPSTVKNPEIGSDK